MPRDPFGKVCPGQVLETIPAQTWNGFIDAANFVRRFQTNRAGIPLNILPEGARVLVRNDSGGTQDRFNILQLSSGAFTPPFDPTDSAQIGEFQNTPILSVRTPYTDYPARYVILQEPLKSLAVGWGLISGVTPCLVNVIDATDVFADVINGDATQLQSGSYGSSQILWKAAGSTGTQWAYVLHGTQASQFVFGKTAGVISAGGTGTVNVYRRGSGVPTWDGVSTLTNVENWFATVNSGKYVLCVQLLGKWMLAAAEC